MADQQPPVRARARGRTAVRGQGGPNAQQQRQLQQAQVAQEQAELSRQQAAAGGSGPVPQAVIPTGTAIQSAGSMRHPNENSARSGNCQYCKTLCENVCCACRAWYCDDPCIEIDWNKHKNYCKPRTVYIDNYEESIKINENIDCKNECSLKNGGSSVKEEKNFTEVETPTKETITPIPTDSYTKIVISWVEDSFYWVFRFDDAETQSKIEGKLNAYCTSILAKPISPDDKECCAPFDGGWYRAELLSKDKDTAAVRFLDFGNDALIKLSEALKIPEELLAIKPLAFRIKFMNKKPNNITINAAFDVKAIKMNDGVCEVLREEYTMKSESLSVMKSPPPTVNVEVNKHDKVKSNGISVDETCHNDLLDNQQRQNVCKNVDQNTEHNMCNVNQEQCQSEIVKIKDKSETQVSTNVKTPPIPTDLFSKIVVTWEEEHCYWAFRLRDSPTQSKIGETLYVYCTSTSAKPISPDDNQCCAPFDGGWYRAKILSKDNDTALVRFIDFGNDASIKLSEALKIPEELLLVKPLAFQVKFVGGKPKEITINGAFDVKPMKMDGDVCEVQLLVYPIENKTSVMNAPPPTVSVSTKVKTPPIPTDRFTKIIISWVDEPFYWAFRLDDAHIQSSIDELLNAYVTSQWVERISPDDNECVAPFDGGWYRAEILSKDNDTAVVRFIDFGNDATIKLSEALKLPNSLLLVTPLAFQVKFSGEKPNKITMNTVFDVKAIKQDGDVCEVQIQGYQMKSVKNSPPTTVSVNDSFNKHDKTETNSISNNKTMSNTNRCQKIYKFPNPRDTIINEKLAHNKESPSAKLNKQNCNQDHLSQRNESVKITDQKDDLNKVSAKVHVPPIPTDIFTKIVVSWVDEPFCWAFRLDDAETQSKIEEKLNVYCTSTRVKRITPDDKKCCASFDGGWYRAEILSKDNDTALVRFIDFGNDASMKLSEALKLPEELLLVKPLAFKVKFAYGKPDEITINVTVDVKAIEMDGDICEVQILGYPIKSETLSVMNSPPPLVSVETSFNKDDRAVTNGIDKTHHKTAINTQHRQGLCDFSNIPPTANERERCINLDQNTERNKYNANHDQYQNEIVEIKDEHDFHKAEESTKVNTTPIPTDKFTKIVISWVDEPFYWAFKLDDAETQSKIEAKLNVYCMSTRVKRVSPDDNKCCASFDGGWYRADILSKNNDTAVVRFMDFGNDASIKLSEALKVPEELLTVNPLAFQVKFVGGRPNEITMNTAFDVKALKMNGDVCEVQIQGYLTESESSPVINSSPPSIAVETSFNKHDRAVTNSTLVDKSHHKTAFNTQHPQGMCDFSNLPQSTNEREIYDNLSQNTEHNKYNVNHDQYQNGIVKIKSEHDVNKQNDEESMKVDATPIPTDKFTKVVLSWLEEPFYWVFRFDDAETQSKIKAKLNVYCTSPRAKLISPHDNKCCALFDGGWYRANILSKNNDTAVVRFMDFGNDASIKLSEALKVPEELLTVNPLAFQVKFAGGKPNEITMNTAFDVKALKMNGDVCEVQIQGYPTESESSPIINSPPPSIAVETSFNKYDGAATNGVSVDKSLHKTAINTQRRQDVPQSTNEREMYDNLSQNTEHNKYNVNEQKAEESTNLDATPIPTDKFTKVVLSWLEEPFYWVFRLDDAETQSKIEAKLNVYCTSPRAKLISPHDNKCCALFDGGWYRANILSKNNDTAVVRFMDFGNDASIKLSEALKVPEELLTVNPLAFQVKFTGGKPNEITMNTAFDVKALKMNGDVCEVQIQGYPTESESSPIVNSPPPSIAVETSFNKYDRAATNGVSVDKSLHKTAINTQHRQDVPQSTNEREIYDNLSQNTEHNKYNVNEQKAEESTNLDATPIPTDKFTKVVLSWLEEPFYWVFRLDDAETQSKIEAKLNVYCTSPRAKLISPHDNKCCALFDGGWYRANILSKNNDTAVVRFMDFGNDASIKLSEALKVPEELLTVNPLAFQVKFTGGKPNEITMNTAFDVKALKMNGDVCEVQIQGYPTESESSPIVNSPPPSIAVETSFNKYDRAATNGVSVDKSLHKTAINTQHRQDVPQSTNEREIYDNLSQNTEHNKYNVNEQKAEESTNLDATPIPTDKFTKVVLSWLEEPFYWVFRLDDAETQSKIEAKLNVYCTSPRAKLISPHDNKCCALFDGGWYRANILSKNNDTAVVRFMDFGNDASIKLSEALKVPEELLTVNPLAFQVKFTGGKPNEITMNTAFDVKALKMNGDVCEVQIQGYPTESESSPIVNSPPPSIAVETSFNKYDRAATNGVSVDKSLHKTAINTQHRQDVPQSTNEREIYDNLSQNTEHNKYNVNEQKAEESTNLDATPIPTDKFTKVVLSWLEEPFYWVFRLDDAETQSKIEAKLNVYCTSPRAKLISPHDNKCCALFDGGWYRANILSKNNDTAVVRFMDFGNDASIKLSEALKVPEELLTVNPLAFQVKFTGGKPNEITMNTAFDVKALKMNGDVCEVQIQGYPTESESSPIVNSPPPSIAVETSFNKYDRAATNGVSVDKSLHKTAINTQHRQDVPQSTNEREIYDNLSQNTEHNKYNVNEQKAEESTNLDATPIPTDKFTKVVLSWLEEPFYWVFRLDDAETQSKIEAKLNVYCTSPRAKLISPHDNKCCALFDGGWYRANILSKNNDTAVVRFMDFGNDASIKLSEALKVPEELLTVNPLAFQVKFAGGKPNEITMNTAFDVKALKMNGDVCEVQIQGYPTESKSSPIINSPPPSIAVETSFNKHDRAATNGISVDKSHHKTAFNTQHRQDICDFSNFPQSTNEREIYDNLSQNTEHNKYNVNHDQYQNRIVKIKSDHDVNEQKAEESTEVDATPIPTDKFTKVVISWVDEPSYWAFKLDDAETQSKIEAKLNVYCMSTRVKRVSPDDNKCCASFDGGWYRADILSKNNDTAVVRFMDFGNDASIKLSEALKVPEELLTVQPLAFRVKFVGGKPNEITINSAFDVKAMKMVGDVCEVQILGYPINSETLSVINSPPPTVAFSDNAVLPSTTDITNIDIIDDPIPLRTPVVHYFPMSRRNNHLIYQLEPSLSKISVQAQTFIGENCTTGFILVDDMVTSTSAIKTIKDIAKQLATTKADPEFKPCLRDQVCACVGGIWYRGFVTRIDPNKINIALIDLGVVVVPDVLAPLPEHAKVFPETAVRCIFTTPPNTLTTAIGEQFVLDNLRKEGGKFLGDTDKFGEVAILPWEPVYEDSGLISEKIKSGAQYKLSAFYSPDEIYLQLNEPNYALSLINLNRDILTYSLKAPLQIRKPWCGQLISCISSKDNKYYRAQVLKKLGDQYRVKFIDFGSIETIALSNIKSLSEELKSIPCYATKVGLKGIPGSSFNNEAIKIMNQLIDKNSSITVIVENDNPTRVRLLEGNNDINKLLYRAMFPSWSSQNKMDSITFTSNDIQHEKWLNGENMRLTILAVKAFNEIVVTNEESKVFTHAVSMTKKINDFCCFVTTPYNPIIQEICLAKYQVGNGNNWYRAMCYASYENSATVYFIDFGNYSDVSHTDIRKMPPGFLDYPAASKTCKVYGLSDSLPDEIKEDIANLYIENYVDSMVVCDNNDGSAVLYIPRFMDILIEHSLTSIRPPPTPFLLPASNF